ncbi:MAG TPA: glutaredoxin family protein [Gaiellaceae bacterium]
MADRPERRRAEPRAGALHGHALTRVALYHAQGCHLCERARDLLLRVRHDSPFELEEIDIGGDPVLEARYREWLPVVEIDGQRAFAYFVNEAAFRRKLQKLQR